MYRMACMFTRCLMHQNGVGFGMPAPTRCAWVCAHLHCQNGFGLVWLLVQISCESLPLDAGFSTCSGIVRSCTSDKGPMDGRTSSNSIAVGKCKGATPEIEICSPSRGIDWDFTGAGILNFSDPGQSPRRAHAPRFCEVGQSIGPPVDREP